MGCQKKHSSLACSASGRWMTCAASPRFIRELGAVSTSSKFAAEGTIAHKIHEKTLTARRNRVSKKYLGRDMTADGHSFTVTQEMIDAVNISVRYITRRYRAAAFDNCFARIEVEKFLSLRHIGIEGLDGGTGDALLFFINNETKQLSEIEVVDYKHGKGVAVEIDNNSQLLCYAVGAVRKYKETNPEPIDYTKLKITMTIVQPRAYHPDGIVRSVTMPYSELLAWQREVLQPKARATLSKQATFNPTPEGCRWCPALPQCPAAKEKVERITKLDFSITPATVRPIKSLSTREKKQIFRYIPLIRDFITAVESQLLTEMLDGEIVYDSVAKLVRKKCNRKFQSSAFDYFSSPLLDVLDEEELYKKKELAIGEVEKLLKSKIGIDKSRKLMQNVTFKPTGQITVVRLSDKRKRYIVTTDDFKTTMEKK